MTAKPPGNEPQPVPGFPGWAWWTGVNGLLYARLVRSEPPVVVRAPSFTALLARIERGQAPGPSFSSAI